MRKILSILLLAVFGLPFATPLLAASGTSDAGVPVCCRRAGKHACAGAMSATSRPEDAPRFSRPADRCPFAPQAGVPVHQDVAEPSASAAIFAALVSHPCGHAQTESMWRMARERSRSKRGPPAVVLS